jgi:putative effector of murein hydrolase LrgA (UPF0299 family)
LRHSCVGLLLLLLLLCTLLQFIWYGWVAALCMLLLLLLLLLACRVVCKVHQVDSHLHQASMQLRGPVELDACIQQCCCCCWRQLHQAAAHPVACVCGQVQQAAQS